MLKNKCLFALAIIILLLYDIMLVGCNPVKRVLQDPGRTEKVGREWEKKNPCYPLTEIKPGKEIITHDTLTNDSLVNALNAEIDSLISTRCTEMYFGDLSKLKSDIEKKLRKECKPEHIYHTRVDTFLKTDNRRLNITNDSLNFYRGANQVLADQLHKQKKQTNKWMIFCFVTIAVIIGHCFYKIRYPKL